MSRATIDTGPYIEAFRRSGGRNGWLGQVQSQAIGRFEALGFPTTKSEDWRYTSLKGLAGVVFEPAAPAEPDPSLLAAAPALDGPRLTFINGSFVAASSDISELPAGVTVRPLYAALEHEIPGLTQIAPFEEHAFTALNTAMLADGAWITVDAGAEVTVPIHLLFVSTGERVASHPRVLVAAGAGSRLVVMESHIGRGSYLTNAVTEIVLEEGAELSHTKLQHDAHAAHHIAFTAVRQAKDSRLVSGALMLGARVARNVISTTLDAPGATCMLGGLGLGRGHQHLDMQTIVDHTASHCVSDQLYKTVLDEAASAVFNGRVLVRAHADGTKAVQNNRNLLLAQSASANTRPQLEIYADDVTCVHGATVGQLDETALFYLRSRGIDPDRGRAMLTYSFVLEVIDRLEPEPIKDLLRDAARAWLKTGMEATS